jgi:hypothetical protein
MPIARGPIFLLDREHGDRLYIRSGPPANETSPRCPATQDCSKIQVAPLADTLDGSNVIELSA